MGEISNALEKVYKRYTAKIKSISGVYSKEVAMDEDFKIAKELVTEFVELEGEDREL